MNEERVNHIAVPESRLAAGTWQGEREVGEGDIYGSYSADLISTESRIRTPFRHDGYLWACISICHGRELEAYRLTPQRFFEGAVTNYNAKVRIDGGEAARNDPNGFYHGMAVKHGGTQYILSGPPSTFVPDPEAASAPTAQLSLFGEEAR